MGTENPQRDTHRGKSVSSAQLENLLASKFIARPDVKAKQFDGGGYTPVRTSDEQYVPFGRSDLSAHLAGTATYGHYLVGPQDTCKIFCLDVDLRPGKPGFPGFMLPNAGLTGEDLGNFDAFDVCEDVRAVWRDRADPRRNFLKYCMRMGAHMLASKVTELLEVPVAAAYSGSKGYHVYGFTGPISALDARDAAEIVLDSLEMFALEKGKSMYGLTNTYEYDNPFACFNIEVYPKQESVDNDRLGNLLRLPLGRNLKSADPTFFMDLTTPMTEMKPVDPIWALTTDSPWKRPGE